MQPGVERNRALPVLHRSLSWLLVDAGVSPVGASMVARAFEDAAPSDEYIFHRLRSRIASGAMAVPSDERGMSGRAAHNPSLSLSLSAKHWHLATHGTPIFTLHRAPKTRTTYGSGREIDHLVLGRQLVHPDVGWSRWRAPAFPVRQDA